MKRLLTILAAATIIVAAAPPAFAHTSVRETNIAENATLAASPEGFTIVFSGETGLAAVTLTNGAGQPIALAYTPPRTMASTFTIPLPALAPGAYTIAWRTMARDGHAMPGAIHFTVAG